MTTAPSVIAGCSVIIITRNEEQSLRACLESVSFAGDIIVVDDESSDRTAEICREFPQVRFFTRKMAEGFGPQKAYALSLARGTWVFSIDADERVSPELSAEIAGKIASGKADGYRVRRDNLVFGAWLKDHRPVMVRLFRRDKARFTLKKVDEAVVVDGHVEDLGACLRHESRSHASLAAYYRIIVQERSFLSAVDLYEMGRRVNILNAPANIILRPLAIFFQKFFLKEGYRHGWRGVVLAYFSALAYAFGYVLLWEMQGAAEASGWRGKNQRPRAFGVGPLKFLRMALSFIFGLDHVKVEEVMGRVKRLRQHKALTRILGPLFRVDHGLIEIEITSVCNLKCYNCDRSCRQAPSDERMSAGQIRRFVHESRAHGRRWRRIRILGGEPTLHPELEDILQCLLTYKREFSPGTLVVLTTNGFGAEVQRVLKDLPPDIIVENTQKLSAVNPFDAFNVAPADLPQYGSVDFTNACAIPSMCGMALSRHGYYACGAGAGIDRVTGLGLGRMSLPPSTDGMTDQLGAFCRLCGHFKHHLGPIEKEEFSPSWQKIYAQYHAAPPVLPLYDGVRDNV